jgi:glycogen synthase
LRILIHSRFYPNIGGIETVVSLLAHEWCRVGEEVILASDVACSPNQRRNFPFPIYYKPHPWKWISLLRWCDVYLQFNVSLKAAWPLLLINRPLIISHHGFYWLLKNGEQRWRDKLKIDFASRASNVFVSSAIAQEIGIQGIVIPNPYDDSKFGLNSYIKRDLDLVFVGRLVSDKGVDCLLRSLALLREEGLSPKLSIIGEGPERHKLDQLCLELKLYNQVTFFGAKSQPEVSNLLRRHQILVVPTLIAEGFGVVALEGLASGCLVIGSELGGLPEAIGPGGMTFPNGDPVALAKSLVNALRDVDFAATRSSEVAAHLAKHRPAHVAKSYLGVLREAMQVSKQ